MSCPERKKREKAAALQSPGEPCGAQAAAALTRAATGAAAGTAKLSSPAPTKSEPCEVPPGFALSLFLHCFRSEGGKLNCKPPQHSVFVFPYIPCCLAGHRFAFAWENHAGFLFVQW